MKLDKLYESLRKILIDDSPNALEKFAAAIIQEVSGEIVRVSASGQQSGGDASIKVPDQIVRCEAKKYSERSSLRERELLGEIAQAIARDPQLELWILVTTKEVPEQCSSALMDYSLQYGAPTLIIDWSTQTPILGHLCAAFPELVRLYYGQKAASLAQKIAKEIDISKAVNYLKSNLCQWSIGWAITAKLCKNNIQEILQYEAESRAIFRQDLSIKREGSSYIKRCQVASNIDSKINSAGEGAVKFILGEEGRGKSWALTDWLERHLSQDKIFIYCSASELNIVRSSSLEQLIARALSSRTEIQDEGYWLHRIRQLIKSPESEVRICLIIDGINESPGCDWESIFSEFQRKKWLNILEFITTSRTQFFRERKFNEAAWVVKPVQIIVPDFSHEEKLKYLDSNSVDASLLSASVLELCNVPRVCRLVVKMSSQLKETNILNIEHLIFEYGKRFDPDNRISLDDESWHMFLQEVAKEVNTDLIEIRKSKIRNWIDNCDSKRIDAAISDLQDGILVKKSDFQAGHVEISPHLVYVSNGLALWKRLKRSKISNKEETLNFLAKELEPLDGLDEKPLIVTSLLAALIIDSDKPNNFEEILSSIITYGLKSHNLTDERASSFVAYTQEFPKAYLSTVDELLSSFRGDEALFVSENLQLAALNEKVSNAILDYSLKEVSKVHVNIQDEAKKEASQRTYTKELTRWLGYIPKVDKFDVLGEQFQFIDSKRHSKAPILCLNMLQAISPPYDRFWKKLAISTTLSFEHHLLETAKWFVRLRADDYEDLIIDIRRAAVELKELSNTESSHSNLAKRASAKLYWLSAEDSDEKAARILVPKPDGYEELEKLDANTSFFLLHRHQIKQALEVREQSTKQLIKRVKSWWADPLLEIPAAFHEKVKALVPEIDVSDVDNGPSASLSDHNLKSILPGIYRCYPEGTKSIFRSQVEELYNRSNDGWFYSAYRLLKSWLIVNEDLVSLLREQLAREDIAASQSSIKDIAIANLVTLTGKYLSSQDYLLWLIENNLNSITEAIMETLPSLNNSEAEFILGKIIEINSPHADWLFINALLHCKSELSKPLIDYVLSLTRRKEEGTVRVAYNVLLKCTSKDELKKSIEKEWNWKEHSDSIIYMIGSKILVRCCDDQNFDELIEKIQPGYILSLASNVQRENRVILARKLTTLLHADHVVTQSQFEEAIETSPRTFYESLRIVNLIDNQSDFFEVTSNDYSERIAKAKHEAMLKLEETKFYSLPLYGVWYSYEDISLLADAAPQEAKMWLFDLTSSQSILRTKVKSAFGFYIQYCKYLLNTDPERGAILWDLLFNLDHPQKYLDSLGNNWLIRIPFESKDSESVESIRNWLWSYNYANSDAILSSLILTIQDCGMSDWLNERILEDRKSNRPLRKVRAIAAENFKLDPNVDFSALNNEKKLLTHHEFALKQYSSIGARALWQKHWFNQYISAKSDVVAYSAFELFLQCVDFRWRLLVEQAKKDTVKLSREREIYFFMRFSEIESAEKKQTDGAKNKFLTRTIVRELYPWSTPSKRK